MATQIATVCSGQHDSSNCSFNKTIHESPITYKSFNGTAKKFKYINHWADDPKCSCRMDYLELRARISNRTSIQKIHKNIPQTYTKLKVTSNPLASYANPRPKYSQ